MAAAGAIVFVFPSPPQQLGAPGKGYLSFSVDCCAVASPEFQGRDVEDTNSELASTIDRFYSGSPAIDLGACARKIALGFLHALVRAGAVLATVIALRRSCCS